MAKIFAIRPNSDFRAISKIKLLRLFEIEQKKNSQHKLIIENISSLIQTFWKAQFRAHLLEACGIFGCGGIGNYIINADWRHSALEFYALFYHQNYN